MDIEYIKMNYFFETLNENHDLSKFSCESEDLNDFIKNDALIQQNENLNVTKLVICDNEVIGFVSLLTDTIPLKNIKEVSTRRHLESKLKNYSKNRLLPAVKIGRFAVDKKYSKKGLGSHILRNVLYIKLIADDKIGLRFVIVEGYAIAYNFYVHKNNFTYLKKDEDLIKNKLDRVIKQNSNQTFYLYQDINKIF